MTKREVLELLEALIENAGNGDSISRQRLLGGIRAAMPLPLAMCECGHDFAAHTGCGVGHCQCCSCEEFLERG